MDQNGVPTIEALEKTGLKEVSKELIGRMAELKFLGYLADKAGKRSQEVLLKKPQRLRDLLPSPFPEQDIIILVNQKVAAWTAWFKMKTGSSSCR